MKPLLATLGITVAPQTSALRWPTRPLRMLLVPGPIKNVMLRFLTDLLNRPTTPPLWTPLTLLLDSLPFPIITQ